MYAIHYLLPFVVIGSLLLHIVLLHVFGSGSASTVPATTVDGDSFLIYYYKDLHVLGLAMLVVACVVTSYPDTLHHPDNFCYVDRYVTPKHIVPE
jgi:ubiquinol-cytochrome c reductase cytochrome b subunit